MSYIPLTAKRMNDGTNTYPHAHAYPVDNTDYEVQHRRYTEMAEFLIEIVCEYSVGSVYGEIDERCETNFIQDIHRYADRYRCDRYQFIKNTQFLHDLHDSYVCKRQMVLQCNLFFNGMTVFDNLIDFVDGWGVDVVAKQLDCDECDLEMTKVA